MTVKELIQRLKAAPPHYEVMIWDEKSGDWDSDLTGKLLAQDNIGIVFTNETVVAQEEEITG